MKDRYSGFQISNDGNERIEIHYNVRVDHSPSWFVLHASCLTIIDIPFFPKNDPNLLNLKR